MAKKIELFSMPDSPALATQNDGYQQFFKEISSLDKTVLIQLKI